MTAPTDLGLGPQEANPLHALNELVDVTEPIAELASVFVPTMCQLNVRENGWLNAGAI